MGVDPGQYSLVVRSGKNFAFKFFGVKTGKFEESSVQREESDGWIGSSQQVGTILRRKQVRGSQSNLVDQAGENRITSQPLSG